MSNFANLFKINHGTRMGMRVSGCMSGWVLGGWSYKFWGFSSGCLVLGSWHLPETLNSELRTPTAEFQTPNARKTYQPSCGPYSSASFALRYNCSGQFGWLPSSKSPLGQRVHSQLAYPLLLRLFHPCSDKSPPCC